MSRRHFTAQGTRFQNEVHPRRLSESRNAGRWPTVWDRIAELRAMPCRFELCLCAGMIAATVGAVVWSVS